MISLLLLFGLRVWLYDSEEVASRIFCVSEPTDLRDRHFRDADFSTALFYFLHCSVQRFHRDRIQGPGALPFARSSNAAIDSRLLVIAGRDQPVFEWAAFEVVELPAEHVPVKRLHRFGVVGVNLKVSDAIHLLLLLLYAGQYSS